MAGALIADLKILRCIRIAKALMEAARHSLHALLAVGDDPPFRIEAQAGQQQIVMIVFPVVQVDVEVIELFDFLWRDAGIDVVATNPDFKKRKLSEIVFHYPEYVDYIRTISYCSWL